MNTEEKSSKLAELFGNFHNLTIGSGQCYSDTPFCGSLIIDPYKTHNVGRAQFAAILLKFPEVMDQFTACDAAARPWAKYHNAANGFCAHRKPAQSDILDEILRMSGDLK